MKEKQEITLDMPMQPQRQNRWKWVRRGILSVVIMGLVVHTFSPLCQQEDEFFIQQEKQQKSHIVLHTGFPPAANVSGLTITSRKAAATAFSPNPASSSVKHISKEHMTLVRNGESWWDRLFPNRHVHLVNVQLPVTTLTVNGTEVEATLSVCGSKKQHFGLGRPQVPDMDSCVETAVVKSDKEDEEDAFGVLEWIPEKTIVLQKSKLYWLVVQAPSNPFQWVNSELGINGYGTAVETEAGWEFKLEGEPIPSAMVVVEDHS